MFRKRFRKLRRRRSYKIVTREGTLVLCALMLYVAIGCRALDVTITGNYHESEEEVKELLGTGPLSGNSVLLYLFNRHRKIGGNTFVDRITVDLENPNSVTVNVSEKMLIGCVEYDGKYWYFDRSGTVLVCKDPAEASGISGGTAGYASGDSPVSTDQEVMQEESTAYVAAGEAADGETEPVSPEMGTPLLSQVRDEYEMAASARIHIRNRFTALASDPVLYGDEFEEGDEEAVNAEDGYEEIAVGESYDGEAAVDPESQYEGYPEEGGYEEDYPDDEINWGEEASEGLDLTEDGEPMNEELGSEDSSEEDGSSADGDPEAGDGEAAADVIEPVIVTEETGDAAFEDTDAQQSEEPDTGEKGRNYIPLVKGMVFSEAVLGYPLPVQFENAFTSLAVLKSFIDRSGYVPDEVLFDADGDLFVTYGEAAVNLGKGENIKQRVTVIGEALPSFAGLNGVLHLENYDGTRNRLIFSKNEKNS